MQIDCLRAFQCHAAQGAVKPVFQHLLALVDLRRQVSGAPLRGWRTLVDLANDARERPVSAKCHLRSPEQAVGARCQHRQAHQLASLFRDQQPAAPLQLRGKIAQRCKRRRRVEIEKRAKALVPGRSEQ